ncbi:hypothetical protein [Rothia terrae]|uniref:hypothetical protein n=1 Tax=Rothia terrae TaxID=396015 RepID=UPI0033FEF407
MSFPKAASEKSVCIRRNTRPPSPVISPATHNCRLSTTTPKKAVHASPHHTQRIDDGSTYDSGAYTHPNPVDELSGTELFDVLAGDKSEDTHSYSIKGDNPPIPVQVSARNARWIFSPKG